jgi:D-lactate dehydrogenase (cytochrome)
MHKLDVLRVEAGEALDTMRAIKRALDPRNIMNPGKTVPLQ